MAIIASDLDGTLLRSDGTFGARTVAALEDVQDRGWTVVFVTGRPPRWMEAVADATGHRGLAICANGGLLLDLATMEVVHAEPFADGAGPEVLERLRRAAPDLTFGVEWADGFAHLPTYPRGTRRSELAAGAAHTVEDAAELFLRPVIKLLARHPSRSSDELAEALTSLVEDVATLTFSSTGLLELSAPGVTKAWALARFATEHGVDAADVVAFGDMPNDLAMLEWAGRSVAVANAHPLVVAAADELTGSNDAEGVADVLDSLGPPARIGVGGHR